MWQYRFISVTRYDVQHTANNLGDNDWELVSMTYEGGLFHMMFKRHRVKDSDPHTWT